MQLHALRTGWPEPMLTGRYEFRTHTQSSAVTAMAWMVELLTAELIEPEGAQSYVWLTVDGRTIGSVLRDGRGSWHPAGVKVVADNPRGPLITLLEHKAPPRLRQRPAPVLAPLFDRRRTVRSRLRTSLSRLRGAIFRLEPPPLGTPTWDVLDNRLGRIIGRVRRPQPGSPPGTRATVFGATGKFIGYVVEPPATPARHLMFVVGGRTVAQLVQNTHTFHVDVTAAGPAGLDPRLVLACAALELANLSSN